MDENKNIETKNPEPIDEKDTQETKPVETKPKETEVENKDTSDLEAQLKKLRDELAKEKKKSDDLARENKEKKNLLRSMQSKEENEAAEKAEREEAMRKRLEELEKQSAVATVSKKVMSFVEDEEASTHIAEALYGADDIDLAMDELMKAWRTREKKLEVKYGRIPSTPIGSENAPKITAEELKKMQYSERLKFKQEYPETYASLSSN